MAEYIDRTQINYNASYEEPLVSKCDVDAMPTSDVTPVIHAKWKVESKGNYNGSWSNCYCSNCKDYYTRDWKYMNYCPNCGADMRGEQE